MDNDRTWCETCHEVHRHGMCPVAKIWSILADGERQLDADADPEFDTNNVYGLVLKGVEARVKLARCANENTATSLSSIEASRVLWRMR